MSKDYYNHPQSPWGKKQKGKQGKKIAKIRIVKNLPDVNALIRAGATNAAILRVIAASKAAVAAAAKADKAIHAAHVLQVRELDCTGLERNIQDLQTALTALKTTTGS